MTDADTSASYNTREESGAGKFVASFVALFFQLGCRQKRWAVSYSGETQEVRKPDGFELCVLFLRQ